MWGKLYNLCRVLTKSIAIAETHGIEQPRSLHDNYIWNMTINRGSWLDGDEIEDGSLMLNLGWYIFTP